jgi:V/A-type H+-transporting ATPase subunit C
MIPKQGHLFKEFLLKEIDIVNLKIVLRMKKEGISNEDIMNHICTVKHIPNWLDKIIKSNYEEICKILDITPFKHIIKKHRQEIENKGSLINLENDLDKYLLKTSLSLLHQNPLSIDIILGYMFAKEIEIMNLKKLVKGKQLGLDEAFISEQLIV